MSRIDFSTALARDVHPRTYAELRSLAGRTAIDNAVSRGQLVRILPDQYCVASSAHSWLMRSHAAVAWAGSGAAVAGLAGLAAWRFAPLPITEIDIVVPRGSHRRGPEWLRVRSLTAELRTARWHGRSEIAPPAVCLVLAYGILPAGKRARFVHDAIRAGVVTVGELEEALATIPRIRDRAELELRVRRIAAGAESYLEERGIADVFRGTKLAGLTFQHELRVRGLRTRIDAAHLPTLTAFEFDSKEHHEKPANRQDDVSRDATLATAGWLTVRFTYKDVIERARWCRDIVREVIAARARQA